MNNSKHHANQLHTITGFLKWYRINSGLSQLELADMCGIHKNTIARYESKYPTNITVVSLLEICNALDVPLNEVFKEI